MEWLYDINMSYEISKTGYRALDFNPRSKQGFSIVKLVSVNVSVIGSKRDNLISNN